MTHKGVVKQAREVHAQAIEAWEMRCKEIQNPSYLELTKGSSEAD